MRDASLIDDVIFGCVSQVGGQAGNLGRNVVLAAGLPESVPGTTCDRQCGSSLQALHFAAQAVMSGVHDVVVAGGVEAMSKIPIGSSVMDGIAMDHGSPQDSELMSERYPGINFSQFEGAELVAEKWDITRQEMEQLAYDSHRRGAEATKNGYFDREIVPIMGFDKKTNKEVLVKHDEVSNNRVLCSIPSISVHGNQNLGNSMAGKSRKDGLFEAAPRGRPNHCCLCLADHRWSLGCARVQCCRSSQTWVIGGSFVLFLFHSKDKF